MQPKRFFVVQPGDVGGETATGPYTLAEAEAEAARVKGEVLPESKLTLRRAQVITCAKCKQTISGNEQIREHIILHYGKGHVAVAVENRRARPVYVRRDDTIYIDELPGLTPNNLDRLQELAAQRVTDTAIEGHHMASIELASLSLLLLVKNGV